ncbi:MAG: 30S ribosomal protein S17 [Patescibacteria group bacterium]
MSEVSKTKKQHIFSGVVVSAKTPKTIVVEVEEMKKHPKYLKRYIVSKKFKVHFEEGSYKEGDKVQFVGCRPMSKDKRWRVSK